MADRDAHSAELAGVRALWSESERRLYPLATTATELYTAAVQVVRGVADGLSDVPDHQVLLERWSQKEEALASALVASGTALPAGVSGDQVLGAAFALRDREIAVEQEERDRTGRVARARSNGDAWVVLHERGTIARGLADPYQCIEFYLPNSLALVSTVEQDPMTAGTNYVASVVAMDGDGAQVAEIDVPGLDDREADDAAVFDRNRIELRRMIEQRLTWKT